MIANSTGNSTVIMSREELLELARKDYERSRKISILEEIIRLHTTGWAYLGIESYDQDKYPIRKLDEDFGKCGCAMHTLDIAGKGHLVNEFMKLADQYEFDCLFSHSDVVKKSAFRLGFDIPESFTKEDLVTRCKLLIEKAKGELKWLS